MIEIFGDLHNAKKLSGGPLGAKRSVSAKSPRGTSVEKKRQKKLLRVEKTNLGKDLLVSPPLLQA